eukprot:SM000219S06672  [mRNA]  locus=s219:23018:24367:+ [translate_table: standard]
MEGSLQLAEGLGIVHCASWLAPAIVQHHIIHAPRQSSCGEKLKNGHRVLPSEREHLKVGQQQTPVVEQRSLYIRLAHCTHGSLGQDSLQRCMPTHKLESRSSAEAGSQVSEAGEAEELTEAELGGRVATMLGLKVGGRVERPAPEVGPGHSQLDAVACQELPEVGVGGRDDHGEAARQRLARQRRDNVVGLCVLHPDDLGDIHSHRSRRSPSVCGSRAQQGDVRQSEQPGPAVTHRHVALPQEAVQQRHGLPEVGLAGGSGHGPAAARCELPEPVPGALVGSSRRRYSLPRCPSNTCAAAAQAMAAAAAQRAASEGSCDELEAQRRLGWVRTATTGSRCVTVERRRRIQKVKRDGAGAAPS